MGSKIYVGGLPYSATEQQLSDLFAAHGAVASARIVTASKGLASIHSTA